jgi:hypothetical protein
MNIASFKYNLLTFRRDQLWFPLVLWALFALIILLVGRDDQTFDIVRAYLATVPLVSGIMAAYAILDDPALELRFATPARAGQYIVQGVLLTFAIQTVCALSFMLFAHLAWMLPTLTAIALGTFGAMLGAHVMAGSFLAGLVWLMEIIIRDAMTVKHWKYVYLFMGLLNPEHPDLLSNQMALFAISVSLLVLAWVFLHRQERYI